MQLREHFSPATFHQHSPETTDESEADGDGWSGGDYDGEISLQLQLPQVLTQTL
jgi:hypothetical protein